MWPNESLLNALNQSFDLIRNIERLSVESSLEELCKMVMREYFTIEALEGWENINLSNLVQEKISENLETASEDFTLNGGSAFMSFLQDKYTNYLKEYSTPYQLVQYIYGVLRPVAHSTVADLCCGTGGTLVEAVNVEPSVAIVANDINRRMANTTHLNLMMHGCQQMMVECSNSIHPEHHKYDDAFDYVVTDPPKGGYRVAGSSSATYHPSSLIEAHVLLDTVSTLRPGGFAAVILSDYILSPSKNVGFWKSIDQQASLRNITRFEIADNKSFARTFYNIVFLQKKAGNNDVPTLSTATIIRQGDSQSAITSTAEWLHNWLVDRQTSNMPDNCKILHPEKLQTWNVAPLFILDEVKSQYPITQLGDVVRRVREKAVFDNDTEYTLLTVKTNGMGLAVRANILGAHLRESAWQFVRKGNLAVSALSADKGATAVITREYDGAIVARDFYIFDVLTKEVDENYLAMVLCSEPVKRQMASMMNKNTIMARISLTNLLSVYIPLPPLDVQRQLVKPMMLATKRLKAAEMQLQEVTQDLENRLFSQK